MVQTLSTCPIANLIVVFGTKHERRCGLVGHGCATGSSARWRNLALIHESLIDRGSYGAGGARKIGKVARLLAGQKHTQLVVKIVRPHAVKTESALGLRSHQTHIVPLILRDEKNWSISRVPGTLDELGENV